MLPNAGKWNQTNEIRDYVTIPVKAPPTPTDKPFGVNLGPFAIGDSRGRLDARYWLVTQVNGKIVLQFSKG